MIRFMIATQQSIDFDVNKLLNDVDIGSSIDPVKVLQKTLTKLHAKMLHLAFTIPQTDEIKAKVQVLM